MKKNNSNKVKLGASDKIVRGFEMCIRDSHDMGFLYTPSCVAGYKLTGSGTGKRAALLAADQLKSRCV